jgi:hypothetical protein
LNTALGYTDSEDNFEIWLRKEDKDPLDCVSLSRLMDMFTIRGLLRDYSKVKCCVICRKETSLNKCSQCKKVKYCGVACQKRGWSRHKHYCK